MNSNINEEKKIIFYIDSVIKGGGAQRVMSLLVNELSRNGYDLALINDIKCQEEEYFIEKGIERYYLDKKKYNNPFLRTISRVIGLRRIVKKENSALIVSFLGRPNIRCLIATLGIRVKKIVSVRNDPYKEYTGSKILKCFINLLFNTADGYVFQTEDAKKYFCRQIQLKAHIILNPVSDVFYEKTKVIDDSHIILYAGRLERQKNVQMLIRAFAIASKEMDRYKLRICGDGSMRRELEELVSKVRIEDKVEFVGYKANIEDEMKKAEIFALSSDYEGMPNSLMEAMAMGLPCISTDCPCGGPKELSGNGAIYLVPIGDVNVFADAMITLMKDKKKREELAKRSKARSDSFRIKTICNQWKEYINEILV